VRLQGFAASVLRIAFASCVLLVGIKHLTSHMAPDRQ